MQILQGGLAIDETIRTLIKTRLQVRLNDEEHLVRMFFGGQWQFQPNGKFLFIPSPTANVNAELFPISGTYYQCDDHLEFNGQRQSASGHIVSVDGCLVKMGDRWVAEFLYAIASHQQQVVSISQPLSATSRSDAATIGGCPVPATFRIQLSGQVDGQAFQELPGTLKLHPHHHPQDPNPCVVRLATDRLSEIGRFLWQSFEGTDTDAGHSLGTVQLAENQVHIEFFPNRTIQAGLTWETQNTGDLAELLPAVGVDVATGTLEFTLRDDQISGTIQASGHIFSTLSDKKTMSNYVAQFTGSRQTVDELPWPDEEAIAPSSEIPPPNDEIPLSAVFDITVQGTTETQAFAPLAGTLIILPCLHSADPNPFSVTLLTDMAHTQHNGCLWWTTFNDVGNRQTLESRVFVETGQVRLVVEPSETFKTLTWKTITAEGQLQSVQVEQGTLTFQVQGNTLQGEVHATGFTLDDRKTLSTYDAHITGNKQVSSLAAELRHQFNASSLTGTWTTDDNAFGRLELQVTSQQIKGTYSARSGGVLSGTIEGNRAEFTWQDRQSVGTGWVRSLGNRGRLVGGWREQNESQPHWFVGTRQSAVLLESRTLTNQDVDELRAIGQELRQQGRGELAIPLLEKVLEFYQRQRSGHPDQDHDNDLITAGNVLNLLLDCELQCQRYHALPIRLQEALAIQRLLDPRASFQRQFQHKADEIMNSVNQTLDQIQNMRSYLQEQAPEIQSTAELRTAYSLLSHHLEALHIQLNVDCQTLAALKHRVTTTQQESDLTWRPLIHWLVSQCNVLRVAIDQVLERQKQFFSHEPELLDDLQMFLQGLDFQNLQGASLEEIAALDAVETRLKNRLASHPQLTDAEKALFQQQYAVMLALTALSSPLEVMRNSLVRLEEANLLAQGMQIVQQSMLGLSEHLESWRGSLIQEVDKIEVLAQGQPFFQELLPLLIQFNAVEAALMTAEKAKTRAFADLLATQAEMQSGIRQVFSTEKVLLSLAKAPPMTFREVVELLQV